MNRIIFPKPDGGVSVFVPSPSCDLTIEQMAEQVVPENTPYKIVDESEIPADRTFRDAWEYVA